MFMCINEVGFFSSLVFWQLMAPAFVLKALVESNIGGDEGMDERLCILLSAC